MSTKNIRIQQKVDTLANWVKNNPILLKNEIGYEEETGKFKIGDGETRWNDLKTEENSKGFKILNIEKHDDITYRITYDVDIASTIERPEVGDALFAKTNKVKILIVTGSEPYKNYIDVSENAADLIPLETDADDLAHGVVENYFLVVGKPYLGEIPVGYFAHTEGENSIAQGRAAHAEGRKTRALGNYSHAEGLRTKSSIGAHAEGHDTEALGDQSHAEGNLTCARGAYSHAEGYSSVADVDATHAEGYMTRAQASYAHSEGYQTIANGNSSHSEGRETVAENVAGHAEGLLTKAIGNYAHAEGDSTEARGNASHAEGHITKAIGNYAHAEGGASQAAGDESHAEGHDTQANGSCSHSEGSETRANGNLSHSEGSYTIADGNAAHAEGHETVASGYASHAEGAKSVASGDYSHAQGVQTTATGQCSFAQGQDSKATKSYSIAMGFGAESAHDHSMAIGNGNKTQNEGEVVLGKNSATTIDSGESILRLGAGQNSNNKKTMFDFKKDGRIKIDTNDISLESSHGGVKIGTDHVNLTSLGIEKGITIGADNHSNSHPAIIIGSQGSQVGGDTPGIGIGQYTNFGGNAVSIGNNTVSMGVAIGEAAKAHTDNVIAIGANAQAGGGNQDSIAVGNAANADAAGAVAIGKNSVAKENGTAIGNNAEAAGINTVQLGTGTNNASNTLQFKNYQIVDKNGKIPDDRLNDTVVKEECLYPVEPDVDFPNYITLVGGDNADAVLLGSQAKEYRDKKKIIGRGSVIIGPNAGYANEDIGYGGSTIIGGNAQVTTPLGIAIGYKSKSLANSIAIGNTAQATYNYEIAIGDDTKSTGFGSVAIGNAAKAHYTSRDGWYLGEPYEFLAPVGGVAIGHGGETISGVAIGGSSYSQSGVAIGPAARTLPIDDNTPSHGVAIGEEVIVEGDGIAIGPNVTATYDSICIGRGIDLINQGGGTDVINIGQTGPTGSPGDHSISLGSKFIEHTNEENAWSTPENTFAVWKYPILNRLTGKIPNERLPEGLQSYYCDYNSSIFSDFLTSNEKFLLYTLPQETNYLEINVYNTYFTPAIIEKDQSTTISAEFSNSVYRASFYFDGLRLYGQQSSSEGWHSTLKLTPLPDYTPSVSETTIIDTNGWDAILPTLTFTAPSDINQCNESNCLFYVEATADEKAFSTIKVMYFDKRIPFSDNTSFRIIGTDSSGAIVTDEIIDSTNNVNIVNRRIDDVSIKNSTNNTYPTRLYMFANVSSTKIEYKNLFNRFYPTYERLYYAYYNQNTMMGYVNLAVTGQSNYLGGINKNQINNYQDFIK